jgi:signal transduction histidine kinase
VPNDDYFLIYEHPYSFESDAWLRAGKSSVSPTCIMNSGYSSGWCQESFGLPLVAAEITCRASGGAACRFVMAPPHRIEEHAQTAAPGSRTSIPALFARKRLEDALRRAREDLEVRVEERTAALLREIEERQKIERILRQQSKLESLGRLAGGVAHDFNNLLAVVLANARVVARSLDETDSRAQQLAEISSACARAAELTRQLLAFGGAAPSGHESVELDRTVSELGRMLLRLVGDAITLEVHTAAEAISVPMQRSQLDQILVNLVVNARDAMPSGGTLSVETRAVTLGDELALTLGLPRGRYASLAVHDTGTGMDEATQLSIFEPFFSTKLEGGGTGLGLSTVYGLVKQAGGAIAVESAPGAGSTFRIYLPIVETAGPSTPAETSAAEVGAGELVLVVEDQAAVRKAVSELAGLLGYRVLSADGPARALELCAKEGCDVLLTDIMLPQMNGVALAERITELCPQARVVFMSGNPGDSLEPWQKAGRAFVFLPKPFGEEALAAALRPRTPD